MKAKITDLMDLYEDRNCPLSPTADQSEEALNDRSRDEDGRNPVEIKASRHRYGWKEFAALAAVLVLLVLSGFAVRQLLDRRGLQPGQTGDPGQTETRFIGGEHTLEQEEQLELNRFLTAFAQQGVENLDADLDEDAELIRFAFIYRRIYDPESIPVQPDDDGELWDTLSPEQVNETLTRLLGRTVTPDETADYNLLRSDPVGGHCSFHDGYFWQEPSGGDHLLRFVLTDRPLRMEDAAGPCVITDFTAYAVNLTLWPLVELDALPALSQEEAEALVQAEKLKPILTGRAQARITEDGYRLWSLAAQPYELDDEEDQHTEPTGFDTVPDDEWDQINGQLTNLARYGFPEMDGTSGLVSEDILYPDRFADATALTDRTDETYEVLFEAYEADPDRWPEFRNLNPALIEVDSELRETGKLRVVGSGTASFRRKNSGIQLIAYSYSPLETDSDSAALEVLRAVDTEWWTETEDSDGTRTVRALILYADGGLYYREGDPNSEFCRFLDGHWRADETGSLVFRLWESPYTAWDRPDDYLVSAAAPPAESWSARFRCELLDSVLNLGQQSERGLGEEDETGTELRFDAVFGSRAAVPEAGRQYEDERPEGLEFWLTQPIYAWDVLDHARIDGLYGGRLYLGRGYQPVLTADGAVETWPDQCVAYECTAYPDYADGGLFVTRITVTDPAVSIYGLTVESSLEDFDTVFRARGYEVTDDYNAYSRLHIAAKGGITVRFYGDLGKLIFSVEVSNRDGIIF